MRMGGPEGNRLHRNAAELNIKREDSHERTATMATSFAAQVPHAFDNANAGNASLSSVCGLVYSS